MDTSLLIKNLRFDGNHLSLDFINTIHDRYATQPRDYIANTATWTEWLVRKELLENEFVKAIQQCDLEEIRQVRELLHRIMLSLIHEKSLTKKDASTYNRLLLKLRKSTPFMVEMGIPTEVTEIDSQQLNSYLLLIIEQSHKLLLSGKTDQIKECGNCGWLFLDTSKSGKRRWCNMKTCGNEVKARRHYEKIKENKKSHAQAIKP